MTLKEYQLKALFALSSGWLTGRPPTAAPWHSDDVALRRGKGGTGRGGDLAEPLESRPMVWWLE